MCIRPFQYQLYLLIEWQQAQAVGASFAGTRFTAIHASPLKRAYMTAQEIHKQQAGSPPLSTSPLFQEQHFGVAEGKSLTGKRDPDIPLAEYFSTGIYPGSLARSERFPEGESLDDVKVRAMQAWTEILLPYARQAARDGNDSVHVAVISHGMFIKEALRALAKYDSALAVCDYQWLRNTAWARVVVELKVRHDLDFLVSHRSWYGRISMKTRTRFSHKACCRLCKFN